MSSSSSSSKEITNRDSVRLLSLFLAKVAAEASDKEIEIIAIAVNNIELSDELLHKFMDPQWKL